MRAKPAQREEACRLRAQGLSIYEIARLVGCASSSVCAWTSDVPLSDEQRARLHRRDEATSVRAGAAIHAVALERHRGYQREGRLKAAEGDPWHMAACLLYWAEGTKSANEAQFTNTDVEMLKLFVTFLRSEFSVSERTITIRVNAYLTNGLSKDAIEAYWLEQLGLPPSALRVGRWKTEVGWQNPKTNVWPYGVCSVRVCNTRIVQHIYGAIQAYMGFDRPDWL